MEIPEGYTLWEDVFAEAMQDPEFATEWNKYAPIEPRRNWYAFWRHTIGSRNFNPRQWVYYWRKFIKLDCVKKEIPS